MREEEPAMIKTEEEIEEEAKVHNLDEEIEQANKEYDIPEEEITRIIPDEEIGQLTDEQEKEMIRITNYFITNGLKNLTGDNFFDIQENIILDTSEEVDLYSDIHQIFELTENRFIAITDLPGAKIQENHQKHKTLKGILGIIECWKNIGKGRLELYESKNEKESDINGPSLEKDMMIGNHHFHADRDIDLTAVELLCNEIDKLQTDHVAHIIGGSVYIRINRPACMVDAKLMIEILRNFNY